MPDREPDRYALWTIAAIAILPAGILAAFGLTGQPWLLTIATVSALGLGYVLGRFSAFRRRRQVGPPPGHPERLG